MKRAAIAFGLLAALLVCGTPLAAQEDGKPVLRMQVQTPGPLTGDAAVVSVYLNDRLVDEYTLEVDEDCISEEVVSSLPKSLSRLSTSNLRALTARQILDFDALPWETMVKDFSAVEIFADGKLVESIRFAGADREQDEKALAAGEGPIQGGGEPQQPDCVANSAVSTTCTPWVQGPPTNHTSTVPCVKFRDPCGVVTWGTKQCTTTTIVSTRTCTTTTTTTWTPTRPGVTCPSTTTTTSTTQDSSTWTSEPSCGPCQ